MTKHSTDETYASAHSARVESVRDDLNRLITHAIDCSNADLYLIEAANNVERLLRLDPITLYNTPDLLTACQALLDWLNEIYPPRVFDGSSGDSGPVRIVALRAQAEAAIAHATGADRPPVAEAFDRLRERFGDSFDAPE